MLQHVLAGQSDSAGQFRGTDCVAIPGLKVEKSLRGLDVPHSGQTGIGSERLLARCSNAFPHFLHSYSNMGIVDFFCFEVIQLLSNSYERQFSDSEVVIENSNCLPKLRAIT